MKIMSQTLTIIKISVLIFFIVLEVRYYVSIGRCVYGGVKEYITMSGKRYQRQPDMFAVKVVDGKCRNTFYYSDKEDRWKMYISAKDVSCSL